MNSSTENDQPLSYVDRLSQHVDDYILSVIEQPSVRLREFEELKDYAGLMNPRDILEVPAEGKVLDLLYPEAKIHRADYLKLNIADYGDDVMVTDWGLAGIHADFFDAVLAVVPMHHASREEKRDYLKGAHRSLKNSGVLAFGEVEDGSDVHRFLDEFINQHTCTGHKGEYPRLDFTSELESAGLIEVSSERRDCPWCFDSLDALYAYMMRLFALDPMTLNDLVDSLDAYLGLTQADGKIMINWSLCYFRGIKAAD